MDRGSFRPKDRARTRRRPSIVIIFVLLPLTTFHNIHTYVSFVPLSHFSTMKKATVAALANDSQPDARAHMIGTVAENPISLLNSDCHDGGMKRRTVHSEMEAMKPAAKKPKLERANVKTARKLSPRVRICNAMIKLRALNLHEPRRIYVARLAGFSSLTSSGFKDDIPALKKEGVIDSPSTDTYRLTPFGISSLPPATPPQNNAEAHTHLLAIVKRVAAPPKKPVPPHKVEEIFNVLKDRQTHAQLDVAHSTGYSGTDSSGFSQIMSAFKHLGLVKNVGKGLICVTDLAFPFEEDTKMSPITPIKEETHCSVATIRDVLPVPSGISRHIITSEKKQLPSEALASRPIAVKSEDPSPTPKSGVVGRICDAMIELRALGLHEPSTKHVALFSKYPGANNHGFNKALGAAKREGYVEKVKDVVRLTEFTISSQPLMAPPKDNEEAQEHLRNLLKAVKCFPTKIDDLFEVLKDGRSHSRETVAVATGYTSADDFGFKKMLSKLSGLGMIKYPSTNSVQLADIAFPYGRNGAAAAAATTTIVKVEEVTEV